MSKAFAGMAAAAVAGAAVGAFLHHKYLHAPKVQTLEKKLKFTEFEDNSKHIDDYEITGSLRGLISKVGQHELHGLLSSSLSAPSLPFARPRT